MGRRLADGESAPIRLYEIPDGGVAGASPRRRGCAGDFSAGQGEGLPPQNCAGSRNLLLRVVNSVSRSTVGNPDTSM